MEVADGQMKKAAASEIGIDEDSEADQLRNSSGEGYTCNTHFKGKDKQRVEEAVENTADTHADHRECGTAFASQTLVHYKVSCHERCSQKHIGGVLNGVLLTGWGCTQQTHHRGHKNTTEDSEC